MATSNGAAHRGQRWPGDTRARFPMITITAGTVCVQIGQCASPLTPFSTTGFMLFLLLTTSDAKNPAQVPWRPTAYGVVLVNTVTLFVA
jgi:hypothetical protein